MEKLALLLPPAFAQKLSERARSSLVRAFDRAERAGAREVRPLALLTVLATQRGSVAQHIIAAHRLRLTENETAVLETAAEASSVTIAPSSAVPLCSPATLSVLSNLRAVASLSAPVPSRELAEALCRASFFAARSEQRFIGTEHLLWGALDVAGRDTELKRVLTRQTVEKLKRHIEELAAASRKFVGLMDIQHAPATPSTPSKTQKKHPTPALESFGQNLIKDARDERLDPVIGREAELERLTAILVRRTKNNPLLVGDPGVGKTALVMGLAQRIAEAKVPPELIGRTLYTVDLGLLVAGSVWRGEFEIRLKEILRETKTTGAILFIDEFHTIIGAGSAPGSLDAANLLKPALASGEIQVIGATTYAEYRRYIVRDQALERRLQPLFLEEPSREATLAILKGLTPKLEAHHGLTIPPETIQASVRLATLYLPERFFPDKAIDLLDEAASRARVRVTQHTSKLALIRELEEHSGALEEKKFAAVAAGHYDEALALRSNQKRLLQETAAAASAYHRSHANAALVLTARNLAELVSETRGIPLKELSDETAVNVTAIAAALKENLSGQAEVIRALTASIRRSRFGLTSQDRPVASLLFLGPKGVGKTECARILARAMFGSQPDANQRFLKLDMAEYSEAHTISRLIGAPPGYVGFEEGGMLTERVRRYPASLILFDEIERAHPKVTELLLHILDDGVLADSQGRRVRFAETIVILTANIDLSEYASSGALGFSGSRAAGKGAHLTAGPTDDLQRELRRRLSAELLDRLDRALLFKSLGKRDIARIVALHLRRYLASLKKSGVRLAIKPATLAWLAARAFKPAEGAREVTRVIERDLEEPFTEYLGAHAEDRTLLLSAALKRNRVVFHPIKRTRA